MGRKRKGDNKKVPVTISVEKWVKDELIKNKPYSNAIEKLIVQWLKKR